MPKKILLVDDEPLILKGLKYSLNRMDIRRILPWMEKTRLKSSSPASMI